MPVQLVSASEAEQELTNWRARELGESEPKAKLEPSRSHVDALNECERKRSTSLVIDKAEK